KTAAARMAFVLLERDNDLMIAAKLTTNPDVLWTPKDKPLAIPDELSEAAVRYVARSREPVILGNADLPSQLAAAPYLRERRPKSLLCLPLIHQGRLLGVWYAESDAESEIRQGSIEMLQLLAGQAGSALENARLYEQLTAASCELSDKNQRLATEL